MLDASCFSKSYTEARARFLVAAEAAGAKLRSFPVASVSGEGLTVDVATIGNAGDPTILTSSGVHGVEGFFGSAVQLALLEQLQRQDRPGTRHVLIHAVNPFGFAQLRRFNEDNVDLNRNFLTKVEQYAGSPDGYARLDSFLNPKSPPMRFEAFKLKAIWKILRHGLELSLIHI